MITADEARREDYLNKYGHDPIPCDKCRIPMNECMAMGCPYGYEPEEEE